MQKIFGIPQNRERVFIISIRKDIDNGTFKFPLPIHYGSVIGTKQDASDFIKLLHPNIKSMILMKNR